MNLPVIARNVLESAKLIAAVSRLLADKVFAGVTGQRRAGSGARGGLARDRHAAQPLPRLRGGCRVAKQALKERKTIRDVVLERGYVAPASSPSSSWTRRWTCCGWRAAAADQPGARSAIAQPAATRSVPHTPVAVNGWAPSSTDVAKPATGISPISTPARPVPSADTHVYHAQNATAVTRTPNTSSATVSVQVGAGHADDPCVTELSTAPATAAMPHARKHVSSTPSRRTTPTPDTVNSTSPIGGSADRNNPGPCHDPPPDSTTTPTATHGGADHGHRPAAAGQQANVNGAMPQHRGHETRLGVALGGQQRGVEPEHSRADHPGQAEQVPDAGPGQSPTVRSSHAYRATAPIAYRMACPLNTG